MLHLGRGEGRGGCRLLHHTQQHICQYVTDGCTIVYDKIIEHQRVD